MVEELDEKSFKNTLEGSDIPVIVDFFADWCGPCQMIKPVFEELSQEYSGKMKFAKVNTDNNGTLAQENDVSGIPCLIIFKDGKEIDRIIGFAGKDMLKQKIDKIIG